MAKEKKKLERKNWISSFALIGEAKVNDEYSFSMDNKSEKSDWVYHRMNLGVDCGDICGTVYAELMGGYGAERDMVVYVHGKNEDGTDDWDNRFEIDWDDRDNEEILETVGDFCFMTVGIEKSKEGKTFYKKFLTQYDLIAYVKEHLEDGMVVNVKGNLKYSSYNGNTQVKKEINSIALSKAENRSKYGAKFIQTMLLTKDSIGATDKENGVIQINAKVLDYLKEYKGKTVKAQIPYAKTFEFEADLSNKEMVEKIMTKVFKVTKGVTEATFEGDLVEGGAVVNVTVDDIPDDIKVLIELGVYTEEEALQKCSDDTNKARRMVIRKPQIKMVEDADGNKTPVIQKFEKKYAEEDLVMDFMDEEDESVDEAQEPTEEPIIATEEEEDWLKDL